MPVFEYKGLNQAGKAVQAIKEAESAKALRAALRRDGIFLTEVVGEQTQGGGAAKGGKPGAPAPRQAPAERANASRRCMGGLRCYLILASGRAEPMPPSNGMRSGDSPTSAFSSSRRCSSLARMPAKAGSSARLTRSSGSATRS